VVVEDVERSAAQAGEAPPRPTTIALIDARPMPHPAPTTRSTGYQRRVWQVVAQIVQFKGEDDSDIHLILFDTGH